LTKLVRYEEARRALAAAHRVDEVNDIRDKAEAMAAYARQAKDTELIQYATEIKVRAERRCGELTRVIEKTPGRRTSSHDAKKSKEETLEGMGLTVQETHRYEQLAAMPEEHFETAIKTAQANVGEVTTAYMLRVAEELRRTVYRKGRPAPRERGTRALHPAQGHLEYGRGQARVGGQLPRRAGACHRL
jgi:hypothetical protein